MNTELDEIMRSRNWCISGETVVSAYQQLSNTTGLHSRMLVVSTSSRRLAAKKFHFSIIYCFLTNVSKAQKDSARHENPRSYKEFGTHVKSVTILFARRNVRQKNNTLLLRPIRPVYKAEGASGAGWRHALCSKPWSAHEVLLFGRKRCCRIAFFPSVN